MPMPSDLVPLPRRRTEAPLKVVVELSHADVEVLIRELNLRTHQPGCHGGALTLATLVQQAFTTGMQYFRHWEETREWLRSQGADPAPGQGASPRTTPPTDAVSAATQAGPADAG
jgi:hypothetical protein